MALCCPGAFLFLWNSLGPIWAEGVDEKVVRLAIERGLRNMEKFSKK